MSTNKLSIVENTKSQLVNRGISVVLGINEDGSENKVTIQPFKIGKTLLILELVAEFFEEGEVATILSQNNAQQTFLQVLVEKLPTLLHTAKPKIFELLSLILLSNKEIIDAEDENNLDEVLAKKVKMLREVAEIEEVFEIIDAGVEMMGIEEIQKNASRLFRKFRRNQETKTTTPTVVAP